MDCVWSSRTRDRYCVACSSVEEPSSVMAILCGVSRAVSMDGMDAENFILPNETRDIYVFL